MLYSIGLSFSIYYLFRKKLKENKYSVLSFNFLIFFPSLVLGWVPWGLQRWMNARLLRWRVVVAMIRHELWMRVAKLCRLGWIRIISKPNKWVGDKHQELVHKQTVEAWRRHSKGRAPKCLLFIGDPSITRWWEGMSLLDYGKWIIQLIHDVSGVAVSLSYYYVHLHISSFLI